MGAPPLDPSLWQAAIDAVREHGGETQAARALGMPVGTTRSTGSWPCRRRERC